MKTMTLLAVGVAALALSACSETGRRGYGGGYGYERSTTVVIDGERGGRRDWDRRDARRDRDLDRRRIEARRDHRDDRRDDRRDRRDDRRDRRDGRG